ncbi:hypothetical protein GGQ86_002231 [Xanthobacter flavus]|uniref:Uncharacterized protein n=1 Tax=Xanthobacter flavus TaxID=281 RepID=A0A9W6CEP0_XANFL|nr:hypothetical protein [Xanthobacter flavus]GLI20486.1 hypothetical protein XFLAVUS301_01600 [Xanthobacter flavus]
MDANVDEAEAAVMPGLVPGIHVDPTAHLFILCARPIHVDGRDKPGHDGLFVTPPPPRQ